MQLLLISLVLGRDYSSCQSSTKLNYLGDILQVITQNSENKLNTRNTERDVADAANTEELMHPPCVILNEENSFCKRFNRVRSRRKRHGNCQSTQEDAA